MLNAGEMDDLQIALWLQQCSGSC